MRVYGVDFTSAPSNSKPLILAVCDLEGTKLHLRERRRLVGARNKRFRLFDEWLQSAGPWIAGLDFPFGQPNGFVRNLGWPATWTDYVSQVAVLGKHRFVETLRAYKDSKAEAQKELLRNTDRKAMSRSPMKLQNPPVAKMFYEGAIRLLRSRVSIEPVRPIAEEARIIVEAYPALVARKWIGSKQSYKNDDKKKCNDDMRFARCDIVHAIQGMAKNDCRRSVQERYGLTVAMTDEDAQACVADESGDQLDSVLCAVQAAWAYSRRGSAYGIPKDIDLLEGWIVDPDMV